MHTRASNSASTAAICLIRPPAVESFRFATTSITLPLGLAYIAAAVEDAGHAVTVIDAVGAAPKTRTQYYKGYLVGLRLPDIVARIPADASAVGISVIFTHEWPAVVRLVELIAQARPDVAIVLGGEHVTSMPEFSLLTAPAHMAVLGEGEETVVALLERLSAGRPVDDLEGIAFRMRGADGRASVRVNQRRPRRTDIDAIREPEWRHFDVRAYHENRFVGGMYSASLTVPLLATRGCPYQCTYCSAPNMWLPRWIPRSPERVVDEIERYVRDYGARNFPFQDLTAIIQRDWIVRFCREILRRGLDITWQLPTGTRSEAIDEEVAGLLKRSGMTSMAYAPESGSETTRRYIKKKMKTDRLFDSVRAAVAGNLNVAIFLVIGFPHDHPDQLAENLPFIDTMAEHGITDVSVGFYMALPGTELFHSLYDSGLIRLDRAYFRHILDSLALVPSQSYCAALPRRRLFGWKLRMYLRFYGAKRRLRERAGLITSLRRAARGLAEASGHDSKLQTAFRNGLTSGWETLRCRFGPRWILRAEEQRLFADWDRVYREVRQAKLAAGALDQTVADTAELHRTNVIGALTRDHSTVRTVALRSA